jgi:hypothetical protein
MAPFAVAEYTLKVVLAFFKALRIALAHFQAFHCEYLSFWHGLERPASATFRGFSAPKGIYG